MITTARTFIIQAALALSLASPALAAGETNLDVHLEPLRPFLGKTWQGRFVNSKPDNPIVDVARWERALNGRAVRIVHSINDGLYGGEILFLWDERKQQIVSYYFTTAGFNTTGTLRFDNGKFTTHERVSGDTGGTTEVRAVTEWQPGGTFRVKSESLKNGKWVPGHEATYEEAPSAKVLFR